MIVTRDTAQVTANETATAVLYEHVWEKWIEAWIVTEQYKQHIRDITRDSSLLSVYLEHMIKMDGPRWGLVQVTVIIW